MKEQQCVQSQCFKGYRLCMLLLPRRSSQTLQVWLKAPLHLQLWVFPLHGLPMVHNHVVSVVTILLYRQTIQYRDNDEATKLIHLWPESMSWNKAVQEDTLFRIQIFILLNTLSLQMQRSYSTSIWGHNSSKSRDECTKGFRFTPDREGLSWEGHM